MKKGLLLLSGLVALGLTVIFLIRDRTPPLTASALLEARALWDDNKLSSYSIKVCKEADALGTEVFVTEITDGHAMRLSLNGDTLAPVATYGVHGLFDTMERELEMLESTKGVAAGPPRATVLKAVFHETLGVPLVFKRFAPNRRSFVLTVEELKTADRVLYPAGS